MRRRLSSLLSNPLVAIAIVAALVIGGIKIYNSMSVDNGTGYYCPGITINGVDMSSLTKVQGESQLGAYVNGIVNASYTLTYGDKSWNFTPAEMGASFNAKEVLQSAWNLGHTGSTADQQKTRSELRMSPMDFTLKFTYNDDRLNSYIKKIADAVYLAPVDADIVITEECPIVVSDSVDGRELNSEELKTLLVALMQYGSTQSVYTLPVVTKEAAISTSTAETSLQLIVTYSTSLTSSSTERCGNVRLALSNFNGFAVRPGEIISFNEIVGERSAIRGYVEGTVYSGNTVTKGMGGGVCQASSTLYGALMYAGLETVERHNHSMVVEYCAASMDAAVSEDAVQDFVFRNNTEHTVYIYTNVVNKQRATVMIYSSRPEYRIDLIQTITQNNIKNQQIETVKDYEGKYAYYTGDHVLKKEGKLGRRSTLERVYYDWDTGEEVKRETLSNDFYSGERDTYYVGVHDPLTGQVVQ